ncbi:T9SS type A sorting domain-containing protein [Winogradskyella sp. 3972H.M.0a.05]|uniref:T9SS type A sorting domain-containing protein n=1 Tax=Winogradskyella sp. 3972H.M.0a.05 TaxID=2950277 RepID=UPI003399D131
MRKSYNFKILFTLAFAFVFTSFSFSQIRMIEVDPSTERVKVKNFGGTTVDISSYRVCTLFNYAGSAPLSSMTLLSGDFNLEPNAEVEFTSAAAMNDTAADFCLYLGSGSFGSPSAMVDFVQWGSSGNGRESVAVSKGIWSAGTFLDDTDAPFQYTGDGSQNGVTFWDSLLSVSDFTISSLKLYPNPTDSELNITFNSNIASGSIEVFNILGKQVFSKDINNANSDSLNISDLAQGLYLIRISSEGQSETKRFIKQ